MNLSHAFFAYIDPVSGTLILQLLIAGVIGTIAFFRKYVWLGIRRLARIVFLRRD